MAYINDSLKAVFLHNVKCGGSYVREILETHYNFEGFAIEKQTIDLNNIDSAKIGKYRYFYLNEPRAKEIFEKYFLFTFVRDPYEKIFSAYKYLKSRIIDWGEKEEYFLDLNIFIENYKNVNNASYFHSFITQYEQLMDISGTVKIQYIGRKEKLDEELINILTILDIDEITHCGELFDNLRPNKQLIKGYNIAYEFDEKSFKFVNEYFSKDFELFGYEKYNTLKEFRHKYGEKVSLIGEKITDIKDIQNIKNKKINDMIKYSNNEKVISDSYKKILKLKFGLFEEKNILERFENIFKIIYDEVTSNEKDYYLKNNMVNLKLEIDKMFEDKKYIFDKTRIELTDLDVDIFSLLKKQNNVKYTCNLCNFISHNELSHKVHNKTCIRKI